ncbi:MAG TPA: HD domain-containing protein [Candidatus Bathyarchaeia archaeon]|nr:HD domain-containing protein [Candidatus Bathyarchaeia archaeon]
MSGYVPRRYRSHKVIHDNLWGTNRYYPEELVIIDSPLFQRLRSIHQTGLAFVTYPSLRHSRFEHSLGVAAVVRRFVRKLRERLKESETSLKSGQYEIPDSLLQQLRLASLLHDCGHGFFSHVSESIYKWTPELTELRHKQEFSSAKPSEILSYLILKSPTFQQFFENHVRPLAPQAKLDFIADLILGKAPPDTYFAAQIINGSLDSDKIDYISRDALYAGVNTTIDVDRIFNDISLIRTEPQVLTLVLDGVLPLERLMFSKVVLYSSVYHHQKVKAADCIVEGLIEYLRESGKKLCGFSFDAAVDFLKVTDFDLLSAGAVQSCDAYTRAMLLRLQQRNLLQRCLVLSRETIENYESCAYFLNRVGQSPEELRKLRDRIVQKTKREIPVHEVWISLPEQPSLREASQTLAIRPGDDQPVRVSDIFPLEGWLRAFSDNKWKGHIFAPPEHSEVVARAAKEVLGEMEVRLNSRSHAYAHVSLE